MGIISWIIVGLIAGALGKLILPGDDPGGFIVTILIGMAGALVGASSWDCWAGPGSRGSTSGPSSWPLWGRLCCLPSTGFGGRLSVAAGGPEWIQALYYNSGICSEVLTYLAAQSAPKVVAGSVVNGTSLRPLTVIL